jgi:hypothetical protein
MKPTEIVAILARRFFELAVTTPPRLLAPIAVRGLTRLEAVRTDMRQASRLRSDR